MSSFFGACDASGSKSFASIIAAEPELALSGRHVLSVRDWTGLVYNRINLPNWKKLIAWWIDGRTALVQLLCDAAVPQHKTLSRLSHDLTWSCCRQNDIVMIFGEVNGDAQPLLLEEQLH
jgi:hypothetical protein